MGATLLEDVKERQETVNARHTRQNEFLNEYVERLPTDGPRIFADPMVESGLDEDEGTTLKDEHGQRPISAALQVAEWERGTERVDAGRTRRVWLPPCHSPRPSAVDVASIPPPTVSAVRA